MCSVAPEAAPGLTLAFKKPVSMKLTDRTCNDWPVESAAETITSAENPEPLIFSIKTPDGFILTFAEEI